MTTRVVLVEDDDKIRNSLIVLIEGSEGMRCVGAYDRAEDAVRDFRTKDADVVLMDINLPGMQGTEAAAHLKEMKPDLQIIMLTVYEDSEKVFESLEAGASGYLLKRTPPDQLLNGIREVMSGGSPMSPTIARRVVQSFKKDAPRKSEAGRPALSAREEEILNLLVKGRQYKEIGEALFISPSTVHTHLHSIYEKLHVRTRAEAMAKLMKR